MRVYIFWILQLILPTRPSKARVWWSFFERKQSHFSLKSATSLPPVTVRWAFLIRRYQLIVCQASGINFLLKRRELMLKRILKPDSFEASTKLFGNPVYFFACANSLSRAASFSDFSDLAFRGRSKPHFFFLDDFGLPVRCCVLSWPGRYRCRGSRVPAAFDLWLLFVRGYINRFDPCRLIQWDLGFFVFCVAIKTVWGSLTV